MRIVRIIEIEAVKDEELTVYHFSIHTDFIHLSGKTITVQKVDFSYDFQIEEFEDVYNLEEFLELVAEEMMDAFPANDELLETNMEVLLNELFLHWPEELLKLEEVPVH